ncbi:hypothetical protein PENTCL1PPCAC_9239, partial [Pristionchus entomophagus]
KKEMIEKHKSMRIGDDQVMLLIDFADFSNLSSPSYLPPDPNVFFDILCLNGTVFEDSPLHYLAYLDDFMKKHFGSNARIDLFVRHFVK